MTGPAARGSLRRFLYPCAAVLGLAAPAWSATGVLLPQADGSTLALPGPAARIVTLAPNLAELVFAAGAGDRLQAVAEYSNFPAEAARIPRIGDAFRIDLERIFEIGPDLVIAWASGNPGTALKKLEQLGIPVWQVEITRPEEIADTVENIALATASGPGGRAAAQGMRERLEELRRLHAHKPAVSYFYQISAQPLYTINGRHIISRGLEICGARNVFSGLPALAPQVSPESVIEADPLAMIAPDNPGQAPALAAWRKWPTLRAVSGGHLLYLPADGISQATPRLLDSIETACRLLDRVRESARRGTPS